ncbi:hypothetical protein BZG36_01415 [Bifiguratus adelaidae]|uniref:Uncharacterized protein n=1 Tax=Bifiguratus adelaidae TaxID=1938954 RepID=A0A261Y509_9FUNG|nr:hypothetical protein BZG36_01415 [Bifiguratus adelaidae]
MTDIHHYTLSPEHLEGVQGRDFFCAQPAARWSDYQLYQTWSLEKDPTLAPFEIAKRYMEVLWQIKDVESLPLDIKHLVIRCIRESPIMSFPAEYTPFDHVQLTISSHLNKPYSGSILLAKPNTHIPNIRFLALVEFSRSSALCRITLVPNVHA